MFLFHVFFGVWNADVLKAPNIILCLKEGVQTFALECKLGVVFLGGGTCMYSLEKHF